MSAYDMNGSPAPESKGEDSKKISFRFCRECSNMLYPKEDRTTNTLMIQRSHMPRKNARSVVHEMPSTFSRNSELLKLEWLSSTSAANAKTSGRLLTLRSRVA
ncbi:hypothetical protein BST61_g8484 [Cercospora zeina]